MSKITPNNREQAVKTLKAYEENSGIKAGTLTDRIPELIKASDGENHFIVALVKKRLDAANERYVASATVQTFGKGPAMEKMAKNFKNQGFSTLVIVHDPMKVEETKQGAPTTSVKGSELTYGGKVVTEENVDQFITDNKVDAKDAKTAEGKLAIVKKWINAKLATK